MEPPRVEIIRGTQTPSDEEAVRAAILDLWRRDVADAVRREGANPWVLQGRALAARQGSGILRARTESAWRFAARLEPSVSSISIGRGDAR